MNFFEIHKIRYGWFEVCFAPHDEKSGWLINSDYLCCDAPVLFLEALADILEGKKRREWLCWQDEPGAAVLLLELCENDILVEIYYSDKDSMELPFSGAELEPEAKELVYRGCFETHRLLDDILIEFGLYENGNGLKLYNKHWGEFPQKEYHRLRKCAAEINKTLDKYDKMFCFSY